MRCPDVDMVASKVDRDARAGEDLWVCIQKYRQCVRDSQEALCVFISEHMDLEMHQQILTNKMHSLFLSIAQSFAQEQVPPPPLLLLLLLLLLLTCDSNPPSIHTWHAHLNASQL